MRILLLFLILSAWLAGCDSSLDQQPNLSQGEQTQASQVVFGPGDPVQPGADPGLKASMQVGPAGAIMPLPDGGRLTIPPGALSKITTIEVTVPTRQKASGSQYVYELRPQGLTLQVPAELTFPAAVNEPQVYWAYESSILNLVQDQGSERTNWRSAPILGPDTVQVSHFTFVYVSIGVDALNRVYLVTDIPGKFLQTGDLLYYLTFDSGSLKGTLPAGNNWHPGHVAGFVGRNTERNADPERVVEAGGLGPAGVNNSTMEVPKYEYDHIYLGPRRVPGGLNDLQRRAVGNFLLAQVGKDYSTIGDTSTGPNIGVPFFNSDSFSCVGLVEAALAKVGKNRLSYFRRLSVALPVEEYRGTDPVEHVAIGVNQTIRMPVYGVVADPILAAQIPGPDLCHYGGVYTADVGRAPHTIVAEKKPPGSEFANATLKLTDRLRQGKAYLFTWTPTADQANQNFDLDLTMNVARVGCRGDALAEVVHRHITFHVRPPIRVDSVTPEQGTFLEHVTIRGVSLGGELATVQFHGDAFQTDPGPGSTDTELDVVVPNIKWTGGLTVTNDLGEKFVFGSTNAVPYAGTYTLRSRGSDSASANQTFHSAGSVGLSLTGNSTASSRAAITGVHIRTGGGLDAGVDSAAGIVVANVTENQRITGSLKFVMPRTDGIFNHPFEGSISADNSTINATFTGPGDQGGFNLTRQTAPPQIRTISPGYARPGDLITITGTDLGGVTASILFGGNVSGPVPSSGNSLVLNVTVPKDAKTGPIMVGSAVSPTEFVVDPPGPVAISDFSPRKGPAGQQVTITGQNLGGLGISSVQFNDKPGLVIGGNHEVLKVLAPALGSASAVVKVTNALTSTPAVSNATYSETGIAEARWNVSFRPDPATLDPLIQGLYNDPYYLREFAEFSGGTVTSGAGVPDAAEFVSEVARFASFVLFNETFAGIGGGRTGNAFFVSIFLTCPDGHLVFDAGADEFFQPGGKAGTFIDQPANIGLTNGRLFRLGEVVRITGSIGRDSFGSAVLTATLPGRGQEIDLTLHNP